MARATCCSATTLVDALRDRAERTPTDRAYLFLLDGESEEVEVTFAELDAQARRGAALLQAHRVTGGRVLLLYAPGPSYVAGFFACLYAGAVAVPAYPPNVGRPDRRIAAIIRACDPACVLTQPWIGDLREALVAETPALGERPWVAFEGDAPPGAADAWHEPAVSADTLAFLQYTSGSTADPKGAMISHGNVVTNLAAAYAAFRYEPSTVGVSWLPPYHDMGLIGAMLPPVSHGLSMVMMSPLHFLQRPARWLEAITRYRGTITGGPSSAYQMCADRVSDAELAGLDLSCLTSAMNGAEPVRASVLERFSNRFAQCGFRREAFYPCYGLAEATLLVTGARSTPAPSERLVDRAALRDGRLRPPASEPSAAQALVASGSPAPGVTVEIVNPATLEPCPADVVGEIWVAGASVARGYWGRADATREAFGFRLPGHGERRFLRTGDLGATSDGMLFVTGRLSDVIIVRGRNHYPQDIEATVERCHPALVPNRCAVFQIEHGGEERLVVVHELPDATRTHAPAIVRAIRRAVSDEHELAVHAVVLIARRTLPRTSSGKIQRRACRRAFLDGTLEIVYEWCEPARPVPATSGGGRAALVAELRALPPGWRREHLRSLLAQQLTVVLALEPGEAVDGYRPLAELGLDSVTALELSELVTLATGVRVPVTALFDLPTLDALAGFLVGELLGDPAVVARARRAPPAISLATIEQLSDEEAGILLDRSATALLGGEIDD